MVSFVRSSLGQRFLLATNSFTHSPIHYSYTQPGSRLHKGGPIGKKAVLAFSFFPKNLGVKHSLLLAQFDQAAYP